MLRALIISKTVPLPLIPGEMFPRHILLVHILEVDHQG